MHSFIRSVAFRRATQARLRGSSASSLPGLTAPLNASLHADKATFAGVRSFSTPPPAAPPPADAALAVQLTPGIKELRMALGREYKAKKAEEYWKTPSVLVKVKERIEAEHNWKISPGEPVTKCFRKVKDQEMRLSFSWKDALVDMTPYNFSDDEEMDMDTDSDDEEYEEFKKMMEEDNEAYKVENRIMEVICVASITKGDGKVLFLVCHIEQSNLIIDQVYNIATNDVESLHNVSASQRRYDDVGTNVARFISEDMREELRMHLQQKLGFDADLCRFVNLYCDYFLRF